MEFLYEAFVIQFVPAKRNHAECTAATESKMNGIHRYLVSDWAFTLLCAGAVWPTRP
jgi:hypothetical protein